MTLDAAHPIAARQISRRFGPKLVLKGVSVEVAEGEVLALIGPNGAGKSTLLRILAGLIKPTSGTVRLFGMPPESRHVHRLVGWVPSGDRSFYLRISGLENLIFFGRLYGLSTREAKRRGLEAMERLGIAEAARQRVGLYSHGMQKRLSLARALLTRPRVLLLDEPTHDLDPEGSRSVRSLIVEDAGSGMAVVWITQRVEEIREFADNVTLLADGEVRFSGSLPHFLSQALVRRYALCLRDGRPPEETLRELSRLVDGRGTITSDPHGLPDWYILSLADDALLGDVLGSLVASQFEIVNCREEQSQIEELFLELSRAAP